MIKDPPNIYQPPVSSKQSSVRETLEEWKRLVEEYLQRSDRIVVIPIPEDINLNTPLENINLALTFYELERREGKNG